MKTKQIKEQFEGLDKIVIIILIFGLVYSVYGIFNAWHNIDLVYNFTNVGNKLNITFTDTGGDFIDRPLDEYYIQSMKDIKVYVFISIFLSLIIGVLICENGKKVN